MSRAFKSDTLGNLTSQQQQHERYILLTESQDEILDPKQIWARRIWLRTGWFRPNRLWSSWPRRSRPKADPGPDRTGPRPTLGQTEQTQDQPWAWPKRPKNCGRPSTLKADAWTYLADAQPTLEQSEQTLITLGQTD